MNQARFENEVTAEQWPEETQTEVIPQSPNRYEIDKIALALSKAQGAMTGAKKDSANPFFKSKYADLASVMDAIRKPFADNELSYVQLMGGSVDCPSVTTILMHSSGQSIQSTVSSKPGKMDIQGQGAVTTYLRRFALSAIAGIAQVDDDGNEAVGNGTVGTEPVDMGRVTRAVVKIRELIDDEDEATVGEALLNVDKHLSNDERIAAQKALKGSKPEGTGKTYWSVYQEWLRAAKAA